MNKQLVISIKVTIGRYSDFVLQIICNSIKKQSKFVAVANVHMLIEAYKDEKFKRILDSADIVTPDGMPLVKTLKWLYGITQDRVAGMDLLPDLLHKAEEEGLGIFFYGGTREMLDETKIYLQKNYPRLKKIGFYSPPFRALTTAEESEIVDEINKYNANLVFIVLGCPKQEKWMAAMKGRVNGVMIGIGGALPVMIGLQKRAPVWMRRYSLEWLYRLLQEPRRLFKRYFVTNTLFIYLVSREKMRLMFKRKGVI